MAVVIIIINNVFTRDCLTRVALCSLLLGNSITIVLLTFPQWGGASLATGQWWFYGSPRSNIQADIKFDRLFTFQLLT